jgi:hypothetical protein
VAASRARVPHSAQVAPHAMSELESVLSADGETDILVAVATAVRSAVLRVAKRADIFSIVVTLILFLYGMLRDSQSEARLTGAIEGENTEVGAAVAQMSNLIEAIGTPATVCSLTWLQAYPYPNAARSMHLPAGLAVAVVRRARKWTLIVAPRFGNQFGMSGWVRNKYLKYARPK